MAEKLDAAWARRILANKKNYEYARDPEGFRVGRTKYIFLSEREATAIRKLIPAPKRKAAKR